MKKNRIYFGLFLINIIGFLIIPLASMAQHEGVNWYFGNKAGLSFSTGKPVAMANGALVTGEGCATISDKKGNLLFYTDGITVYNRKHIKMPQGTGLMGHSSSSQSAIILKKPSSDSIYYIFTIASHAGSKDGFRYSLVNINKDSGYGDIVKKNILVNSKCIEKICAARHSNRKDFWILINDFDDSVLSYQLTDTGLSLKPFISKVTVNGESLGCMKSNLQSNKIAIGIYDLKLIAPKSLFYVFNFNNSTGELSGKLSIESTSTAKFDIAYGVEFSPDGTKLYGTTMDSPYKIIQYNLNAGSSTAVSNSGKILNSQLNKAPCSCCYYFGAVQLAPDGKIYAVSTCDSFLNVISNPDSLGNACNYIPRSVSLKGKKCGLGLPSFFLGYILPNCSIITKISRTICKGDTFLGYYTSGYHNDTFYAKNGCDSIRILNLIVKEKVNFNPLADTTSICDSIATLVVDNGFKKYKWNTGDTTRKITGNQSGFYIIQVEDSNTCRYSDSTILSILNIKIMQKDTIICESQRIKLSVDTTSFLSVRFPIKNDFESGDTSNFINGRITKINGGMVLGPYAKENVFYYLKNLPLHDSVIISFNILIHDTWDGNVTPLGPDIWELMLDNTRVFKTSFSNNVLYNQSYPGSYPTASYPAMTGSDSNTLPKRCNPSKTKTSLYRVNFKIPHKDISLKFGFLGGSSSSACDESWSIDSFYLQIIEKNMVKYKWSTGDTTKTISVQPTKTTVYYVTVSNGISSCNDSIKVLVNELPKVITNLRDTTICFGRSLKANAKGVGGDNLSYQFKWYLDETLLSLTDTIRINSSSLFNSSGDAKSLKIIIGDKCGSKADSITRIIQVVPSPKSDFTFGPVCINNVIPFQYTGSKPITKFYWDFNGKDTSTLENTSKSFNSLGTKKVKLTVTSDNNCSETIEKEIIVKPISKADFMANDNVCETDSVPFINKSKDAEAYNWKFGDGQNSSDENPKHLYNIGGISMTFNVTLVALVMKGCSDSITKAVTVNANPISDFSYSLNGFNVKLKATQKEYTEYKWVLGDGNSVTTVDSLTYNYTKSAVGHTVCLKPTNAAGCKTETCKKLNDGTIGIGEFNASSGIRIYPNPNRGSFTLMLEKPEKDFSIEIYNLLGVKVMSVETSPNKLSNSVDVNVAEGIYIVRVKNGFTTFNNKISITK
jgi:PKD repeat protein